MKITFLMPHLNIAGGVRINLNYAHFLAQRGHDVTVVVVSPKAWRRNLVNWLGIKTRWYKGFLPKVLRVKTMEGANIPDADIVVAGFWVGGIFFKDYPKNKGIQYQFVMHDERLYHGNRKEVSAVYNYPSKKLAISSWLKEILKKDFNQDSELFLTPVDFELFNKKDIQKKDNEIRVLMLDHTYEWKGIKEGFEAFNSAKEKVPSLKLIGYGVRNKNSEHLKYDEYHYSIPQKKLAELYSSCDIFLCPSWYEGLGMPAMEAMACGSCVVTFDTGGSRDYAFEGKTAFVAKHRDVKDLTEKLVLAAENKELREKIADEGYRFIHKDIENWEQSTDRLERLFKRMLENNSK